MKTLGTTYVTLFLLFASAIKAQVPQLNSHPSAAATIYLDFDGEVVTGTAWNWGGPINAAAPALSTAGITEIFNRVAEDYRIFNVNITTSLAVYQAAPITKRTQVIITPSNSWYGNAGGVAYIGSFSWGDGTPAWVFTSMLSNNIKYIAEAASHEAGHTLGLQHQSTYNSSCGKTAEYASGQGTGEIGWAPIMGVGYYKNLTTWFNGRNSVDCNTYQNDIEVIAGAENDFGLRNDDFADTYTDASDVAFVGSNFTVSGLINSSTDIDAFRLVLNGSANFNLMAIPQNVGTANSGANIDIRVSLLNSLGDTVGRYNPTDLLNAGLDTNLLAGTYYLIAEGVGNINLNDYGSLGYYSLAGSLNSVLPVRNIRLKGSVNSNVHALSWSYEADEPVKEFELQISHDGSSFEKFLSFNSAERSATYQSVLSSRVFYRIRAITVANESSYYSNVISLGADQKGSPVIIVNTLVRNEAKLNSTGRFNYEVMEANGKKIASGMMNIGANKIDVSGAAMGLLLLRITTPDGQFTEKLIKR